LVKYWIGGIPIAEVKRCTKAVRDSATSFVDRSRCGDIAMDHHQETRGAAAEAARAADRRPPAASSSAIIAASADRAQLAAGAVVVWNRGAVPR
jgi:hypothetical protein